MARFDRTFCSQCGGEFGPGNQGFSHCEDHRRFPGAIRSDADYFAAMQSAIGRLVFARENRAVLDDLQLTAIEDIFDDLRTYAHRRDDAPTMRREAFKVIEGRSDDIA